MFESRISAGATEKLPCLENMSMSSWSYGMEGHAEKCVERYCELANKTTQQLYKVSTPCIDDHHFKEEELKSVGELSNTCSQIVLKWLYLGRIGRLDILWSVNKLARSITKCTKACDKRLSRLISSIHHTCDYKQYCHVGNTAQRCRLGLFQDSDFAGDVEDSESTSEGLLYIFGSHTFVPICWTCKKQTSVSHSSTEGEIISFDAGVGVGYRSVAFFPKPIQQHQRSRRNTTSNNHTQNQTKVPTQHDNLDLSNVHYVSSNAKSSQLGAMLYIYFF